jgi:hypothetical protein
MVKLGRARSKEFRRGLNRVRKAQRPPFNVDERALTWPPERLEQKSSLNHVVQSVS